MIPTTTIQVIREKNTDKYTPDKPFFVFWGIFFIAFWIFFNKETPAIQYGGSAVLSFLFGYYASQAFDYYVYRFKGQHITTTTEQCEVIKIP